MTTSPLPISVCMIAGQEARRIQRSLASVAGWVSEIIVVINDEVADGTDAIAASMGAKNSAAVKAAQPWVLALDADEVVSPELRRELEALFADAGQRDRFTAYCFPRCSFYCGRWIRHGDWYPDRQTRLWRRLTAEWGGENPHDKLLVTGPVGRLRGDLLHYTNDSINQHLHKITTFSDEFVRQRQTVTRAPSFFDLAVRPGWRFLRAYFFRLGFLDGWPGYYIAWLNAFSTLTRYCKLCEVQLKRTPPDEDLPRH